MSLESKPTADIDNWTLNGTPGVHQWLAGQVRNHPNPDGLITEGRYQYTSKVVRMFEDDVGQKWVETLNTLYRLGKPFEVKDGN